MRAAIAATENYFQCRQRVVPDSAVLNQTDEDFAPACDRHGFATDEHFRLAWARMNLRRDERN